MSFRMFPDEAVAARQAQRPSCGLSGGSNILDFTEGRAGSRRAHWRSGPDAPPRACEPPRAGGENRFPLFNDGFWKKS